jgi:ATP-dependent DNA helicase RecG
VVCPAREISARAGGVTAVAHHRALVRRLAPARVGLLHGALPPEDKEAVLQRFRDGALDVLVATTVVELGVDVPNATVMVVEEADRFGLAQLHQLRGRVGRGKQNQDSVCWLLTGGDAQAGLASPAAPERLRQLVGTSDGFRIAEADLEQRGYGDLFGARQAGAPPLTFGDLPGTLALLEVARAEAAAVIAADPALSHADHARLRAAVEQRWSRAALYDEEAG